jgi:short-subunit dehydrogenase
MAYSNGGSYCISKFAMYGMSKVLREELKNDGIRVSSVLPGATFTASWEGSDLSQDRFLSPEDVAEMVVATYKLSPRTVVEDIVLRPQLGDL